MSRSLLNTLTGRRALAGLAAAVLVGGLVVSASMASAQSMTDVVELDGNPQASNAAGDDWQTLLGSGVGTAPAYAAKTSVPIVDGDSNSSTPDASYYTGGGSKDVRDITQWQHSTGDVAPDKDEILNAFAAAYRQDTTSSLPGDELILTFGSDRYSNGGDAQMGFWFFKSNVTLNPNGRFNGQHQNGDILVLSDFSGGGKVSTINVYKWDNGGLVSLPAGGGSVDCRDQGHNTKVCAIENNAETDALWDYMPKAGTNKKYPVGSFLEGAINVSELVGSTADSCFASFLAETRSSTSTSAQLKDFALGRFPICDPSTTMAGTSATASPAVVHRGESATFSFSEDNDGDLPLTNVSVSLSPSVAGCGSSLTTPASGDTANTGTLDPNETWVFQCTATNLQADTTITATGHGRDFRNKDVTNCTTQADLVDPTKVCNSNEVASQSVKVIHPQTTLTMSASPAIVHVGDTVTLSFSETNNGTRAEDNLTSVSVNAPRCATAPVLDPANQTAAADSELDFGETWTYSCTFTAAGTDNGATLAAVATGTDITTTTVSYCANVNAPNGVYCSQNERATTSITIINPSTSLRATASALVTYTFVETNNGDSVINNPSVSAPSCDTTPTLTTKAGGNQDSVLDPNESWTYTCTKTITGSVPTAAAVTVTATGTGTDAAGAVVTACDGNVPAAPRVCIADERDSVAVTVQHNAPN